MEKVKASAWGKNTLVSVHAFRGGGRRGAVPVSAAPLPRVELGGPHSSTIQSYPAWVPNQDRDERPGHSASFILSGPGQVLFSLPRVCSLMAPQPRGAKNPSSRFLGRLAFGLGLTPGPQGVLCIVCVCASVSLSVLSAVVGSSEAAWSTGPGFGGQ